MLLFVEKGGEKAGSATEGEIPRRILCPRMAESLGLAGFSTGSKARKTGSEHLDIDEMKWYLRHCLK
jgi:hypothetical protein